MCKPPDGRDWWWEKLSLALVGKALLSKTLIQLSADGWGRAPSVVVLWPETTQPWGLWALSPSRGGGCGFDFIMIVALPAISVWLLLCLCTRVSFFGGLQRPLVNDCSTGSCSFVTFTGGDKLMSLYSAVLNRKYPSPLNILVLNFIQKFTF